jgi:hypothetical protein
VRSTELRIQDHDLSFVHSFYLSFFLSFFLSGVLLIWMFPVNVMCSDGALQYGELVSIAQTLESGTTYQVRIGNASTITEVDGSKLRSTWYLVLPCCYISCYHRHFFDGWSPVCHACHKLTGIYKHACY